MTETPTHPMWAWGIGESSDSYYDYWCYHEANEYEIHMFWDKGQGHSVEVIPINGFDENNDPIYGYNEESDNFDTEEQALEYVEELMEEYA
jgi:hypothetical protein